MKLNKAAFSLILPIFLSVNNSFPQTSDIRPFELKTGREAAIISSGAAIGITGLIVILNNDRLTKDEINSLNPDDVNKFDRVAIGPYQKDMLGDALLYSSYLFPLSFLAYDETKNDFSTLALMYGEVLLINHSLNALVKGLTKKPDHSFMIIPVHQKKYFRLMPGILFIQDTHQPPLRIRFLLQRFFPNI